MSELPSEDEMTALAVKTMYAAKQEIPCGTSPDIDISIGQRKTEITVETSNGKTWNKTFMTRRLNNKANKNAEKLFNAQVQELLKETEANAEQQKEKANDSDRHSNIKEKV